MAVVIDEVFARFGSKSYAIDKINSLDIRQSFPYGTGLLGSVAIVAAIVTIGLLSTLSKPSGVTAALAAVDALLIFLIVKLRARSRIKQYALILVTSAGEAEVVSSRDAQTVFDLRAEIEGAMLKRARRRD